MINLELVNKMNHDNHILKQNIEDYKTALEFLVQKHKKIQSENWNVEKLAMENSYLKHKIDTYRVLGIAGITSETPNGNFKDIIF